MLRNWTQSTCSFYISKLYFSLILQKTKWMMLSHVVLAITCQSSIHICCCKVSLYYCEKSAMLYTVGQWQRWMYTHGTLNSLKYLPGQAMGWKFCMNIPVLRWNWNVDQLMLWDFRYFLIFDKYYTVCSGRIFHSKCTIQLFKRYASLCWKWLCN